MMDYDLTWYAARMDRDGMAAEVVIPTGQASFVQYGMRPIRAVVKDPAYVIPTWDNKVLWLPVIRRVPRPLVKKLHTRRRAMSPGEMAPVATW